MGKREAWSVWFKQVNEVCMEELGVGARVLEEVYNWIEAYEDDLSPSEALEDLLDVSELARAIRHSRSVTDTGGFELRGVSIPYNEDW